MTLVDANLLLYAYDRSSRFHDEARSWLDLQLSGPALVGLPWSVLLAFLRISTNPRALRHPLAIEEAMEIVASWLDLPCVVTPEAGSEHWAILSRLLPQSQARGPLVMDAHLAALAIEHGATLATTDRDFARFEGLRLQDPIQPA